MNSTLFQLYVGTCMLLSLVACRPDPVVVEVPVPYAIDSLALLPQWENHPQFSGREKKQWLGWADDSICVLIGDNACHTLDANGSILTDWSGFLLLPTNHTNQSYRPSLSQHWMVLQNLNFGALRIGHPIVQNTRTFFSLSEYPQTQGLSFPLLQYWEPMSAAGAFVTSTPGEFGWAGWAVDTAGFQGLVYVGGTLSSIPGNPIVERVEWHPLPAPTSASVSLGFLVQVGDAVLVGIGGSTDTSSFFGDKLFMWRLDQGYEQIPVERYGSQELRTACSAHDGKTAYLVVGPGDMFLVKPDGSLEKKFEGIYSTGVTHLSAVKDIRDYFAFSFNQELALLDKNRANVWFAPNLGLDGHNINDVTLFKDTMIISSLTGGIFYQAMSDVWPEDQR